VPRFVEELDVDWRGRGAGAMLCTMPSDPVLSELLERCRHDHEAWVNGNGAPYSLPDDGTILGAIGGFARGGSETAQLQRLVAAQWRRGTGTIEYLNGGVDGDLAWLVFIERGTVEFVADADGAERRWDLRVTEVFRRSGSEWQRVHRHADPLVDRHELADIAALLA
jgi:ketosteroid isomerase-like protein